MPPLGPEQSGTAQADAINWPVVALTFATLVVIYGIWYSFSVFLVALVRHFGWSRALVSGAFSSFVLLHGMLGPVVGWLARRYGPRSALGGHLGSRMRTRRR